MLESDKNVYIYDGNDKSEGNRNDIKKSGGNLLTEEFDYEKYSLFWGLQVLRQ
jgi:hypothetical protein